ncbi:MAG: LamG-like jellyroll fold domain-containing protein, partial [Verrucomicrobiales bacterium]
GSISEGRWKFHIVREGTEQELVAQVTGDGFGYRVKGHRLDDGVWHHIAVVYYGMVRQDGQPELSIFVDGKRQEKFFGGKRLSLREVNTVTDASDSMPLLIGKSTTSQARSFYGDIDELYVVEGALSDESVAKLAAGKALDENS